MIANKLFRSTVPVFFLGMAISLCMFTFFFSEVIEARVFERAAGFALLCAFVSGLAGGWGDSKDFSNLPKTSLLHWQRAAIASSGLVLAGGAFALMLFGVSFTGAIEQFITMFAFISSLVMAQFAGFMLSHAMVTSSVSKMGSSQDESDTNASVNGQKTTHASMEDREVESSSVTPMRNAQPAC